MRLAHRWRHTWKLLQQRSQANVVLTASSALLRRGAVELSALNEGGGVRRAKCSAGSGEKRARASSARALPLREGNLECGVIVPVAVFSPRHSIRESTCSVDITASGGTHMSPCTPVPDISGTSSAGAAALGDDRPLGASAGAATLAELSTSVKAVCVG